MEDLKNSRGIGSVDYTADILELFCRKSTSLSLKEISSEMNASPAKVFPYLVSLMRTGLLKKRDQNNYEIGQLTLSLAFKALNYLNPLDETAKITREICIQTSHLAVISSWGSFGPTVIKTFDSNSNLHSKIRVGSVMSILNSTIGNTFARFLPLKIIKDSLKFEEFRYAGKKTTANEKKEFFNFIADNKFEDLYTVTENKPVYGLTSISVPVFSMSNELQFVITIFDHTHLIMPNIVELKKLIDEKLLKLSRTLGSS